MTDVIREVNIPTLLILPAFARQIAKQPIKRKKEPPVPLYILMFEYGLKSSYIETDNSITMDPISLILEFSDEILKNKNLTASEYHSLNERIVSSPLVENVWVRGDSIFYRMPMAVNIYDDVLKIMNSDYSNVSDFYKKLVACPVDKVPKWPHNKGYFIMKNNIPVAVLKKHSTLRDLLEDELGVRIEGTADLFRKFSYTADIYIP